MGRLLALASIALLFVAAAFAQFETAEVLGSVRDASGGALPKAALTLTNENTGIEMKSVADENGNYDFFNVKAGNYTLTAELAGFNKFSTSGVVVNVQARQRVDVALKIGAVTHP